MPPNRYICDIWYKLLQYYYEEKPAIFLIKQREQNLVKHATSAYSLMQNLNRG